MSMPQPLPQASNADAVWLETELATVEENLALDEAVLEAAHEDALPSTAVRLWVPRETVVVVGSSSRLAEEVDREACRRLGARIVRRPSGGATVVVGPGCVMWSVVERHSATMPGIDGLHERFLSPICSALRSRGLAATRMGTSDLALNDRKFSGNALRVKRQAVLYHGTFLDTFDLSLIETLLPHPPREPDYRASRPHREFLTNIGMGVEAIAASLREAFGATTSSPWCPADRVAGLLACRYRHPDWTERL